jgi:hypothetical protein
MLQIFHLYVSKVDRVLLLDTQLPRCHRAGIDVRTGEAEGARAGGQVVQAPRGCAKQSAGASIKTCTDASTVVN